MKTLKEKIKQLSNEIVEIISPLLEINDKLIDQNLSDIKKNEDLITIILVSKGNVACPIEIEIKKLERVSVNLFLNGTGPILEDLVVNRDDVKYMKDDIHNLLSNPISSRVFEIDSIARKVTYTYSQDMGSGVKSMSYTGGNLGIFGFMKKKEIKSYEYVPWI